MRTFEDQVDALQMRNMEYALLIVECKAVSINRFCITARGISTIDNTGRLATSDPNNGNNNLHSE